MKHSREHFTVCYKACNPPFYPEGMVDCQYNEYLRTGIEPYYVRRAAEREEERRIACLAQSATDARAT